jgi:hypothetical protein
MAKTNKTKNVMQLVIVVVALTVAGFLIYKNFIGNNTISEPMINVSEGRQSVDSFKKAVEVLDDAKFKNLIKFGNWPVIVGEKGRANPFVKL